MKKNISFLCISGFLICFIFSSCKKKNDEPTNTEKITGYDWYITAAKVDPQVTVPGQLTSVNSIYDMMEPCYKDDKIRFTSSGSYSVEKGSNLCNTADLNYSNAWSFKDGETKLYMENYGNTGSPITFTIVELSTNIITFTAPVTTTAELRLVLQAYGLDYLLASSKSADPTFATGTKFTLVLRAL